MQLQEPPPHALFIQWGEFKAGAFGLPAIVTLILFAVLVAYLWFR
jgi:hypothetical protein